MRSLFGVPIDTLLAVLLGVFALGSAAIGALALRNRAVLRMGVRNVPRRRAQTALIVMGLMLATLLFSASFTTGDTLAHSSRLRALGELGEVDVWVRAPEAAAQSEDELGTGADARPRYFDAALAVRAREALERHPGVAGVAPIASETAPVVAPERRLSEPEATVLGLDPTAGEGFAALRTSDDIALPVASLARGEAFVSAELARNLGIGRGDAVRVYLGQRPANLRVADVYVRGADPGGKLSLVLPLAHLQALSGNEGTVNGVVVTHEGGPADGAGHTAATVAALAPVLRGSELEAQPVKQEALGLADAEDGGFAEIFTILGGFSIMAGILMIFLIFVMLAAERKRELGIARGVGMQRAHVVRMFTFEGAVYSLLASAVGSALGVAVGWVMVRVLSVAFSAFGEHLVFTVGWRSPLLAYALGMAITFGVVLGSSWRVSRLNVVRAIRDIPEPQGHKRTLKGLLGSLALLVIAAGLVALGIRVTNLFAYMLGASLLVVGGALLARRLGLPDRPVFSVAGLALLTWWLLPNSVADRLLPENLVGAGDIEMFLLSGVMIVVAAVWTVVYNSDILLGAITAVFGRVKGLPPVLKTAVSYPMMNRFRTGMTLAMISLVMFTLVVMSLIVSSLGTVWDDTDRWGGGYEVFAAGSYANPIADAGPLRRFGTASSGTVRTVASVAQAPVRAKHAGTERELADLLLHGGDDAYLGSVRYGFRTRDAAYASDRAVWRALRDQPNLAVVSTATIPDRGEIGEGGEELFSFEGVYAQDRRLPPNPYIQVRDPRTGEDTRLRVIGIVDDAALYAGTVVTSKRTLDAVAGQVVPPRQFFLDLVPGADARAAANALEGRFLEHGLQAVSIREEIDKFASANDVFYTLLQGYMALGLVVGIAALGVIAARAVVERRQQIGVMRAMGFQKSQVQLSFLLESSFVALLGIGLGVALGFGLSRNLVDDIASDFAGVRYDVPWVRIALIAAVAYAASLLTTYLPARQAANVHPAEALRFE